MLLLAVVIRLTVVAKRAKRRRMATHPAPAEAGDDVVPERGQRPSFQLTAPGVHRGQSDATLKSYVTAPSDSGYGGSGDLAGAHRAGSSDLDSLASGVDSMYSAQQQGRHPASSAALALHQHHAHLRQSQYSLNMQMRNLAQMAEDVRVQIAEVEAAAAAAQTPDPQVDGRFRQLSSHRQMLEQQHAQLATQQAALESQRRDLLVAVQRELDALNPPADPSTAPVPAPSALVPGEVLLSAGGSFSSMESAATGRPSAAAAVASAPPAHGTPGAAVDEMSRSASHHSVETTRTLQSATTARGPASSGEAAVAMQLQSLRQAIETEARMQHTYAVQEGHYVPASATVVVPETANAAAAAPNGAARALSHSASMDDAIVRPPASKPAPPARSYSFKSFQAARGGAALTSSGSNSAVAE